MLVRGEKTSLANEEAISCNAQGGVMMKAAPAPSFVMIEPEFLLEVLVIPLDPPAQLGHVDQIDQRGRSPAVPTKRYSGVKSMA